MDTFRPMYRAYALLSQEMKYDPRLMWCMNLERYRDLCKEVGFGSDGKRALDPSGTHFLGIPILIVEADVITLSLRIE